MLITSAPLILYYIDNPDINHTMQNNYYIYIIIHIFHYIFHNNLESYLYNALVITMSTLFSILTYPNLGSKILLILQLEQYTVFSSSFYLEGTSIWRTCHCSNTIPHIQFYQDCKINIISAIFTTGSQELVRLNLKASQQSTSHYVHVLLYNLLCL